MEQNNRPMQFTLDQVLIYNPTYLPKMKKPHEEDYQDAKLLFFYPEKKCIQEKRNNVGLIEGSIRFFNSQSEPGAQDPSPKKGRFILATNIFTIIAKEVEKDFWLVVVCSRIGKERRFKSYEFEIEEYLEEDSLFCYDRELGDSI